MCCQTNCARNEEVGHEYSPDMNGFTMCHSHSVKQPILKYGYFLACETMWLLTSALNYISCLEWCRDSWMDVLTDDKTTVSSSYSTATGSSHAILDTTSGYFRWSGSDTQKWIQVSSFIISNGIEWKTN